VNTNLELLCPNYFHHTRITVWSDVFVLVDFWLVDFSTGNHFNEVRNN